MEVDSKKEEKPDKGAGGDHDSDDEHDKSTESEEQNDKPVKDDKPSASPPKSKTPKKPKKVEAKVKDSGDEDETSEGEASGVSVFLPLITRDQKVTSHHSSRRFTCHDNTSLLLSRKNSLA